MRKLLLLIPLLIVSCTDESASKDALEKAGFTDIELTGWAPWSCSDSDKFATSFEATNPHGNRVSGVVCCGLLKRCTIRF